MARNGAVSLQLIAACVGIFALALGAIVFVRVLTTPSRSSSLSAAGISQQNTAPASTLPAVDPHLIANVPAGKPVESLAFSPDGTMLADELSSGVVQLRDAGTGAMSGTLNSGYSDASKTGNGSSLAFSADGKTLAVGVASETGSTSRVELWDVATHRETGEFGVTAAEVLSLAFSPDGKILAIAAGKTLVLHTMATGASISIPDDQQSYQGNAWYVSFSADGKTLAVVSGTGVLRIWDMAAARFTAGVVIDPAARYTGPPGDAPFPSVEAAAISPDTRFVVTAGSVQGYNSSQAYDTPTIWRWQPGSNKYITLTNNISAQEDDVESGALNPAGELFATGDDYGEIRLWNMATDTPTATFQSPAGKDLIDALTFSRTGQVLAGASNSGGPAGNSIQLWNLQGDARRRATPANTGSEAASSGSKATSTGSKAGSTPVATASQSGVVTVDVDGAPVPAQILAIARELLTDAHNHDSTAIDRLLDPTDLNSAHAVALNKLLAQPGVFEEIITVLTKTHGTTQDGYTSWPGFLLAGIGNPLTSADAKTLGVTSTQDYKGIVIYIGEAYNAKRYVPKLASIALNTP